MTYQGEQSVTDQVENNVTSDKLILSLFPGIDLLGRPFEDAGFCVVRGPDLIYGGDIRSFNVPSGCFAGVIGGSPCQEFSALNRQESTGYGHAMIEEYRRVVAQAAPLWWLFENVPRAPDVRIDGYSWQRFSLDLGWFSDSGRLRHFQFGSDSGVKLDPPIGVRRLGLRPAALASDGRSFAELLHCQGLPADFDLPSFNVEGKKRAVGNGVPLPLGRVLTALILRDVYGVTARVEQSVTSRRDDSVTEPAQIGVTPRSLKGVTYQGEQSVTAPGAKSVTAQDELSVTCACGCGRRPIGRAIYAGSACRKRAQRLRSFPRSG